MVIAALAVLLFWAGWLAWTGSSLALRGTTIWARVGGVALAVTGVIGLLYAARALAS